MCFSGRNRSTNFEYTNINAIICRFNCPIIPTRTSSVTYINKTWSDPTAWPSGHVPDGTEDEITIPYNWWMILDTDTPTLKKLIIDGVL